uniref:UDP-glucuronosyltransferase n=1 Tax=Ascaris lumbricoides TaxID=6252 RepID=A0A9J2PP07_ASCLU
YVAFGSIVDWTIAPPNVIKSFIEAFNSLVDYRVIWSIKIKLPKRLASHVMTISWAPQSAILHDNRTKLFFTHAGLKSVKEAICAGVPLLTIPFFADQMKNSLLAYQCGFAEIIHKRKITSTKLLSAMLQILQNDTYQQRMLSVRSIYTDRIMAPLKVETFWVERILRSKSAEVAFRMRAVEMPWIPYLCFDVTLMRNRRGISVVNRITSMDQVELGSNLENILKFFTKIKCKRETDCNDLNALEANQFPAEKNYLTNFFIFIAFLQQVVSAVYNIRQLSMNKINSYLTMMMSINTDERTGRYLYIHPIAFAIFVAVPLDRFRVLSLSFLSTLIPTSFKNDFSETIKLSLELTIDVEIINTEMK